MNPTPDMKPPSDPSPAETGMTDMPSRPKELRALCRFAAGLSHELNNLLAVVNSNAIELIGQESLPDETRQAARRIMVAGERAASLTKQVLLFSGQHPCWAKPLRVNALLEDSRDAWERQLGPAITLQLNLADQEIGVSADRELLAALVSSLLANAVDALPGAGEVHVAASVVVPGELSTVAAEQMGSDPCVCLHVSDTGEGIPPSIQAKVFEPFFTTRSVKSRLGLGLAVVSGIVDSHRGWIGLDSRPGRGTSVDVLLPMVELPAPAAAASLASQPPLEAKTILLVEDDTLLRETTAEVFRMAGCRVLQAESADQARETWKWHADRIHLLFTDVVLPGGVSGLDIAAEFFADNPALKVICTSGFSHEIMQRLGDLPEGWMYLPKPCLPPQMLKAVNELLASPSS